MRYVLWTLLVGMSVMTRYLNAEELLPDPLSFKEFSALMQVQSGDTDVKARFFKHGTMARVEPQEGIRNGKKMTMTGMILLLDEKNSSKIMINTKQKIYAHIKPGSMMDRQSPIPVNLSEIKAITSRTRVKEEPFAGYSTVVEDMVMLDRRGKFWQARVWSARELGGFPIKMELKDDTNRQVTMHLTEVKLESPDAGLFVIPADYTEKKKSAESPEAP